jgi:hypothetical protein
MISVSGKLKLNNFKTTHEYSVTGRPICFINFSRNELVVTNRLLGMHAVAVERSQTSLVTFNSCVAHSQWIIIEGNTHKFYGELIQPRKQSSSLLRCAEFASSLIIGTHHSNRRKIINRANLIWFSRQRTWLKYLSPAYWLNRLRIALIECPYWY